MVRPQSRIVTFRLSAEEYATLLRFCEPSGSRSVSEFVRAAVLERVETLGSPRISLSSDLSTLGRTLVTLDTALNDASLRIRRLLGSSDSESAGRAGHA